MTGPRTFADVVAGTAPCHRVYEDAAHLAFLHQQPVRKGHTIVIPKRVADSVWDLAPEEYDALWRVTAQVADLLRRRLPCQRVCLAAVGWEVRHAHVHLVPTDAAGQFPQLGGAALSIDAAEALARRLRGE